MQEYRAYINKTSSGLAATIREAMDCIQWEKNVHKDSVVFLKPNFTYPYYKEGITTSPEVLENVLRILKTRAKRVILGESDGGNHSFTADTAFENHRMKDICGTLGVELVNLSHLQVKTVEGKVQGKNIFIHVPKFLVDEVDCFVDVPVLKVHVMTEVTIAIKNLWGCYPDPMRGLHHQHLSHKLALLAKTLNPKIIVVDATYGLDKHGPMWGQPVKLDLILAADNPVVSDALGASVMGFNPRRIKHISVSARTVPGPLDLSEVTMNQDWRPYARHFTIERTFIDRFSILFFNSYPLAKLIFDSPLTGVTYKIARVCRSREEKNTAADIQNKAQFY